MSNASTLKEYEQYDLREEYDLAKMPILPRGRFAQNRRAGRNVAILDPDVAKAFPNDEAVNTALRLVIQMAGIPQIQEVTANG
jgi:hypothetical protein